MRRSVLALILVLAALLLSACGGGGSSSGAGSGGSSTSASGGDAQAGDGAGAAKTPEQVWAKEVEGVMRKFENTSATSVANLHTSTSKYTLEPTYATYSDELAKLGKELEATHPPAACEELRERMGVLAKKVSQILGVLGDQPELSPEEYVALTAQQRYKFARVGRRLTNATIYPHC
jgi:predicted small secreted protein